MEHKALGQAGSLASYSESLGLLYSSGGSGSPGFWVSVPAAWLGQPAVLASHYHPVGSMYMEQGVDICPRFQGFWFDPWYCITP